MFQHGPLHSKTCLCLGFLYVAEFLTVIHCHQVLGNQGYDGSAADVWSCGVILFVIMAGYLPFDEIDLPTLYKKVITIIFARLTVNTLSICNVLLHYELNNFYNICRHLHY